MSSRVRRSAIAKHYASAKSSPTFATIKQTNVIVASTGATQVKQAALAMAAQSAQLFGLASTYIGPTDHLATMNQSLGMASSYSGAPQLQRLNCVDDTIAQPGIHRVNAFGVYTTVPEPLTTPVGYQVIFIGSLAPQPDMLLAQHLATATLALPTIGQSCLIQAVTEQSVADTLVEWLDEYNGVQVDIVEEQLSTKTAEGLLIAAPSNVMAEIKQHYQVHWDISALGCDAQIIDLGVIQTQASPAEFDFKPARGQWHSRTKEPAWSEVRDLEAVTLRLLSHPELTAQLKLQQQYDTTALGNTIVEPGAADATIVAPWLETNSTLGVAVASASNTRYVAISPYWQSINAVVQGVYKLVASGAQPWGLAIQYNHPVQDTLQLAFSESVRGIQAAATQLDLNLLAQHTSWYPVDRLQASANPYPTIVHALGKLEDVANAITLDFIQPGNTICLVGPRRNELGGSVLYTLYNEIGSQVPQPDLATVSRELNFMLELIRQRLVPTCHVIGRGGMIKTLADMCYGPTGSLRTGIELDLATVPSANLTSTQKLFSESNGFIFEIDPRLLPSLQRHAATYQIEFYPIGQIHDNEVFNLRNGATTVLNMPVGGLAEEWLRGWPGML